VLLVPVPQADEASPLEEVPQMEKRAEGPLGGGAEGDWERDRAVESP